MRKIKYHTVFKNYRNNYSKFPGVTFLATAASIKIIALCHVNTRVNSENADPQSGKRR